MVLEKIQNRNRPMRRIFKDCHRAGIVCWVFRLSLLKG